MTKKELEEIKLAIADGHETNLSKLIKMLEEKVEDFLDVDLSTPIGRQDCRDTWNSARDVKNMKKTFWNRFWYVFCGVSALYLISLIGVGIKEKFKEWMG